MRGGQSPFSTPGLVDESTERELPDDTSAALDTASLLADDGRVRDAVDLLTAQNRRRRSPLVELTLARLRHAGFDRVVNPPVEPQPLLGPVDLKTADGVPWVSPDQLSLAPLRQGLKQFGCLLVPGLINEAQVQSLVHGIDQTFGAFDDWKAAPATKRDDEAAAWFTPFQPLPPYGGRALGGRSFTRASGGVWTVESPRMLFEVIDVFAKTGLGSLIAAHLGEQPALSAAKCNLRRTPVHIPGGWHQDGSFLGQNVSTVDVWVALSECGRDAPGLDIVPHRFNHLLEAGADTVSVPHETVLATIDPLDVDVVSPEFHPGDVLLFDQFFVHRTATTPEMTKERYAIETWFFAPSRYPQQQIPLLY